MGDEVELAWVVDVSNGEGLQEISLIVNGYRVASEALDLGGDWSGGNGAALGIFSSGIAGSGARSDLTAADFISGEIFVDRGLYFYSDINYRPPTTDSDEDGLPDEWERLYALGDLGVLGEGDADGDGLSDTGEFDELTDPTLADTDGDDLADGAEIENGSDPRNPDTDGDLLDDGEEAEAGPIRTTLTPMKTASPTGERWMPGRTRPIPTILRASSRRNWVCRRRLSTCLEYYRRTMFVISAPGRSTCWTSP